MAEGAAALWSTNVRGMDPTGEAFSLLSFLTGGIGARASLDGLSSTSFPSGVSGMPVEVFENRSPLVVLERELRPDSGGPGEYRGGLGYRTTYAGFRLEEPYRLSPFTDRIQNAAPGLNGGLPGAPGDFLTDGQNADGKKTLLLAPHQEVTLATPGGGGYGRPADRDPEAVRDDVLDGLVSAGQAREVYGVAVGPGGDIDWDQTAKLRGGSQRDERFP